MKKSERGGQGGQGKAKIAQKRGHLTQKPPKIARQGVLQPPKHPKNNIYYIYYIIYYILYIIYHISYTFLHFISDFLRFEDFLEVHFWAIFALLMSPTPPWTPNIILFWALVVIFNHLGGVGTIFRFLKSESFSKRSYTPKSVAFGRIRGFSKRLIFLNSVLDTQNDLKPTIIQYNICCTYKKRLDYVVRSEKKWKGGSGGSGEGKNRSKKGSFDPKTAENRAPGGLTTPQTSQK